MLYVAAALCVVGRFGKLITEPSPVLYMHKSSVEVAACSLHEYEERRSYSRRQCQYSSRGLWVVTY
jgi:hypothetical protein